jgi:hypothetical protein
MADNVPMGMEFMRWQNAPSLTETIASGNSPLFKTLGILLAQGKKDEEPTVGVPPVAQGLSQTQVPGGIGMAPVMPNQSSIGIQPPSLYGQLPQLPTLDALGTATPQTNYDDQIKNYWKGSKL